MRHPRQSRGEHLCLLSGPQALAYIARISRYIAGENPVAPGRVARELLLAGDSLAIFPRRGRPSLALSGRRELVIVRPYVIVYRILPDDETVDVLRVWHAAQDRN